MIKNTLFIVIITINLTFSQETKLNFYAQPGLDVLHSPLNKDVGVMFRGAQFIAYITSNITDRLIAAVELHPHVNFKNGPEFEIERLFLKYYFQDYFSIRAGRMYMPVGYWNQNYNFAAVMIPVINRPNILQPGHEDGFINTRDIGIQFEGNDIGGLRFSYKAMVSNGIGKNGGLGGNFRNFDTHFAYTTNISIQPIDGLKFIVSGIYNDVIHKGDPSQFSSANFIDNVRQIAYNGSIVYMNSDYKFELIAEYISTINAYKNLGNKSIYSVIFYTGYKATDKIIPYLYSEFTKFDSSDPLFMPGTGLDLSTVSNELTLQSNFKVSPGIRYRLNTNAVLKFEYNLYSFDKEKFVHGPSTQFAIGF
ncbi:MAG: hypothetical protein EAZ27_07420 [Cytophagales bacterium]|nr:MAG: hypothetical protein EAZ27_07420 [Cytophagales bacterium]